MHLRRKWPECLNRINRNSLRVHCSDCLNFSIGNSRFTIQWKDEITEMERWLIQGSIQLNGSKWDLRERNSFRTLERMIPMMQMAAPIAPDVFRCIVWLVAMTCTPWSNASAAWQHFRLWLVEVQFYANKSGITSLGRSVDLRCWLAAFHLATIDSKKTPFLTDLKEGKKGRVQLDFEDPQCL